MISTNAATSPPTTNLIIIINPRNYQPTNPIHRRLISAIEDTPHIPKSAGAVKQHAKVL